MRRGFRSVAVSISLLAGCASTPEFPPAPQVPFDQVRAKQMLQEGNNTVAGKVLLRLSSGGALTCAKGSVRLFPLTTYASAWADAVYYAQASEPETPADFAYLPKSKRMPDSRFDANFLTTQRSVHCDRDGQFLIEFIKDGDYLLEADLIWQQDIHDDLHFYYGREYFSKEGAVVKRFRILGGRMVFLDMQWTVKNKRYAF